ncbi:MAG: alpha-L-fucosidase, partial [Anaerolineales bacterium]|nr:alpha-L-fucosidase [Anaerolineales bacterium]
MNLSTRIVKTPPGTGEFLLPTDYDTKNMQRSKSMNDKPVTKPASNLVGTLMGAILILLGIAFLMVRFILSVFDFDFGHYTWPLFIIVPGVLMFLSAFILERKAGVTLAMFGGMVTMTGVILMLQNTFDLFATWAYVWALVAPTSMGLAKLVYGALRGLRVAWSADFGYAPVDPEVRHLTTVAAQVQPDVIVNNRVDKGRAGMAGMTTGAEFLGDFGTPEQEVPATGVPGVDWESCITMNRHWGWNRADTAWKSDQELIRMLVDIASKGGNLLLNIG